MIRSTYKKEPIRGILGHLKHSMHSILMTSQGTCSLKEHIFDHEIPNLLSDWLLFIPTPFVTAVDTL